MEGPSEDLASIETLDATELSIELQKNGLSAGTADTFEGNLLKHNIFLCTHIVQHATIALYP